MYFLLNRENSKFLSYAFKVLYICTLCDSKNIKMIIEVVVYDNLIKPRQVIWITSYVVKYVDNTVKKTC